MKREEDVKLKVFRIGLVPKDFEEFVKSVLEEFYSKVRYELPPLVEVYIYGFTRDKLGFLEQEALELGVMAIGDFITLHEAWRGWPRIHVDYERCSRLDKEKIRALLIHEAGHSVLHGSPLFYTITIKTEIFENLDARTIAEILYFASVVVKDLEVFEFLLQQGFREDVVRYIDFLREDYRGIVCTKIIDVLQLAKLLAAYSALSMYVDIELHESCKPLVDPIINVLDRCRSGDLESKTYCLVSKLLDILRYTKEAL